MKKYIKTYLNHFDYTISDFIPCEICGAKAVDIHHINGRLGENANNIENLMALCRHCHTLAHNELMSKKQLQYLHNEYLKI